MIIFNTILCCIFNTIYSSIGNLPTLKQQHPVSSFVGSGGMFTMEQENVLLRCFGLFDLDDDGKLTNADVESVSDEGW
jgi:hypothetical protein